MKFVKAGSGISQPEVEILNVSPHGFWFRDASVGQLFNVEFSHGHHLYWPALDVDLDLERIEHPEKYPLVARSQG